MEVRHYIGQGIEFREIISRQYSALYHLAQQYKLMGKQVWIDLYDQDTWMLTLELGPAKPKEVCHG